MEGNLETIFLCISKLISTPQLIHVSRKVKCTGARPQLAAFSGALQQWQGRTLSSADTAFFTFLLLLSLFLSSLWFLKKNTFIPLGLAEAIPAIQYLICIVTDTPLVPSVAVLLSHLTSHVQEY